MRETQPDDAQLKDKAPLAALSPSDMLSYLESGAI